MRRNLSVIEIINWFFLLVSWRINIQDEQKDGSNHLWGVSGCRSWYMPARFHSCILTNRNRAWLNINTIVMRRRDCLRHHSALNLNNNVQFAPEKAAGMSSCWFKGDEAKLNFGLARQPDEKCCDALSCNFSSCPIHSGILLKTGSSKKGAEAVTWSNNLHRAKKTHHF